MRATNKCIPTLVTFPNNTNNNNKFYFPSDKLQNKHQTILKAQPGIVNFSVNIIHFLRNSNCLNVYSLFSRPVR